MYILTYIQPSTPPDTNVHINIHTRVVRKGRGLSQYNLTDMSE